MPGGIGDAVPGITGARYKTAGEAWAAAGGMKLVRGGRPGARGGRAAVATRPGDAGYPRPGAGGRTKAASTGSGFAGSMVPFSAVPPDTVIGVGEM